MSVYFATAGRYTKIGFSHNPLSRVSTITRHGTRPDDLPYLADAEIIGWIPGGTRREHELHATFADARVAGEWFVIDSAVIRKLIWADPAGVDVERMTTLAVMMMDRHKDATRDDVTAAGVTVEAPPRESFAAFSAVFSENLSRVRRAS